MKKRPLPNCRSRTLGREKFSRLSASAFPPCSQAVRPAPNAQPLSCQAVPQKLPPATKGEGPTEKHYGYVPEYIRMGAPCFRWRDEGRSLGVVDGWTLKGRTMRFGSRSSGCGVMSVRASRSRWHIEQYFQRSTDDLGLDHFEGRSWRGFHHHFMLSALAYLFILTVYLHRKKILVRRGN